MMKFEVDNEQRIIWVIGSGTIEADDYQTAMPEMNDAVAEWPRFRLLLDWEHVEERTPESESDQFLALRKYKSRCERAAIIVARERTADAAIVLDVFNCETRAFDPSERDDAWAWLRSGAGLKGTAA